MVEKNPSAHPQRTHASVPIPEVQIRIATEGGLALTADPTQAAHPPLQCRTPKSEYGKIDFSTNGSVHFRDCSLQCRLPELLNMDVIGKSEKKRLALMFEVKL